MLGTRRSLFVLVAVVGCAKVEPAGEPAVAGPVDPTRDSATLVSRAQRADAVFAGGVSRIEYAMSQAQSDDRALPFTFVTWRVDVAMRGVRAGQEFTARFLGGPLPGGGALDVTEMPRFAVGQHDIVFIRRNGEIGCPLVDGALGRIQLVAGGQATDPGSPSSTDPTLPTVIARAIDDAVLAPAAQARSADPAVPFSFARPRRATTEQMTRAAGRMQARAIPAAPPSVHR